MSKERLKEMLRGRARPSGGMCLACQHKHSSCGWLDFESMPVMRLDKDGERVVRCTEFERASVTTEPPPAPKPQPAA